MISSPVSFRAVVRTAFRTMPSDGNNYWLVHIPDRRKNASIARQTNNRAAWFRHHAVIPASCPCQSGIPIRIAVVEPDRTTEERLREFGAQSKLRVYLAHFTDHVELTRNISPAGKFFAIGVSDAETRKASIDAHLCVAEKEEADVVIFPELTVIPEHRREIGRRHLKRMDDQQHTPVLILTGSFHETRQGERKVNRAELFGSSGVLMSHHKIRPFGDAEETAEDIDSGDCLGLLASAIGVIAIPICKDFSDALGVNWAEVGPDWCFVPSMGNQTTIDAHSAQARRLWKILFRTVSLVSNQEVSGEAMPGFACAHEVEHVLAGGGILDATIR